jgi:hypothetical protein
MVDPRIDIEFSQALVGKLCPAFAPALQHLRAVPLPHLLTKAVLVHRAHGQHDMRTWQVERRKRTRHLIEPGGLVVKAGIVDLTSDNRATIYGALLWMADKLQSDQGERARAIWSEKGKQAFENGRSEPG